MKRFNKTAVALATAGAMTMAMVPNATAEEDNTSVEGTPVEDILNDNPNEFPEDPREPIVVEEVTNNENNDGENGPNKQRAEDEEGYTRAEDSDSDLKPEDLPDGGVAGDTYETYVPENAENPEELKPEDVVDEEDAPKVLRALAGLAGAGAVIYLLGQAYKAVTSSSGNPVLVPAERADQAPTAEDEAATGELVANHGEEIVAQAAEAGVADNGAAAANGATADNGADADRGVSAATGNNTIAQGLVGLLLASILGAAAFVFGRRQLV